MTDPMDEDEDEFSELTGAQFSRVDLVSAPANGSPGWLVMKQDAAGLLDPGFVRDLIAKAEPRAEAPMTDLVTMTGSPAAVAKLMREGALALAMPADEVAKAKNDTTGRKPKEAAVAADTATAPIAKDAETEVDTGMDGLDPTAMLGTEDGGDYAGDPATPGTPAWEAVDASAALKWAVILGRAKAAIENLADRELLEAASADPDDAENAWDLQDVCCAIDYAISVLAPYAMSEQLEADTGTEAMAVMKAAAGAEAPLSVIEPLALVAKAGRVLSSSNEARIREAAASLQQVLSTLPSAPIADDVAKEAAMAKETTTTPAADATPEPVAKAAEPTAPAATEPAAAPAAPAAPVAKADGEDAKVASMLPVYDADGNLIGVTDPANVTPLQGTKAASSDTTEAAPAAPADDGASLTPAPPADAGVPADDVAKGATQTPVPTEGADPRAELTSLISKAVTEALDGRGTAEDVTKGAVAGLLAQVGALEDRLATVEKSDAAPRVFTNGATPPPGQLRGQNEPPAGQAPQVDVAKAADLKRQMMHGTAQEQTAAARQLNELAIAQLGAIQNAPGAPLFAPPAAQG